MEKLQKALERARQQRAKLQAATLTEPEATADERGNNMAPIVYQHTRVLPMEEHRLREQRVVAGLFQEELSDTFRILRTQTLARMSAAGYSTLAITSASRGEGKTLTAINLALSLAMDPNHTVLLVDADLRRPAIHRYFGIEPECGLSDHLLTGVPLASCLINPGIPHLVVLPAGRSLRESSEVLSSPKMMGLAQEMKQRYPNRIIIYDLAPLLATSDALTFMRFVDCCLLVVQEGTSKKADIRRSLELLETFDVIGTVLNKSTQKTTYYY